MVPVAPIITAISLVFTVHMPSIYIVRSAYSRISSASILITFLSSPEIATVYYQTRSFVVIIIIIIIITIIITIFIIIIITAVISVSTLTCCRSANQQVI